MIRYIITDLDGTLLPMQQETFVNAYFGGLCKKLIPYGFDANALVQNIWNGTKAMIMNDGSFSNEEVFWNYFKSVYGQDILKYEPIFYDFYVNEFQAVQNVCGFQSESAKVIQYVKDHNLRIILATNPIFPQIATHSRIAWAGLSVNDFEYITTYENAHYTKPNPQYYVEILNHVGLKAEECLMVGNDVKEDMVAASIGMHVFLLTNDLIDHGETNLDSYPHGNFDDFYAYLTFTIYNLYFNLNLIG